MSTKFSVEDEFKEAQKWLLTDEDIERAKIMLGHDSAEARDLYITDASENNIRNYAHGNGDDNPLYTDPTYGAKTRWGSMIAPPAMAEVMTKTFYGDPPPKPVRDASKGLFRGVHVFVSGSEKFFYRPIYPGDALYTFGIGVIASLTAKSQLKVELLDTYKGKPPTAATKKNDVAIIFSITYKLS